MVGPAMEPFERQLKRLAAVVDGVLGGIDALRRPHSQGHAGEIRPAAPAATTVDLIQCPVQFAYACQESGGLSRIRTSPKNPNLNSIQSGFTDA